MNSIITAALMREHRDDLLRQVETNRRVNAARHLDDVAPQAVGTRRAARHPFVVLHGWLARGYL